MYSTHTFSMESKHTTYGPGKAAQRASGAYGAHLGVRLSASASLSIPSQHLHRPGYPSLRKQVLGLSRQRPVGRARYRHLLARLVQCPRRDKRGYRRLTPDGVCGEKLIRTVACVLRLAPAVFLHFSSVNSLKLHYGFCKTPLGRLAGLEKG